VRDSETRGLASEKNMEVQTATGPTTLDELLVIVPGLRTMRSMNADLLRHLLNRKRKECTWCGNPVGKGRSTWCSDQCVEAFRSRCDSGHQVLLVTKRDKFICQLCGRNTKESQEAGIQASRAAGLRPGVAPFSTAATTRRDEIWAQYGYARGRWSEVDHIVPVVEGGGLLGIENLRWVCGACHAEVTRVLAKRRAK